MAHSDILGHWVNWWVNCSCGGSTALVVVVVRSVVALVGHWWHWWSNWWSNWVNALVLVVALLVALVTLGH